MGRYDGGESKATKIESAGEPRPLARGAKKKGERKKGPRARFDELKSSKDKLLMYVAWIAQDAARKKQHPEWYAEKSGQYMIRWTDRFDEQMVKHQKLIEAAILDNVINEIGALDFMVKRP